MSSFPADGMTKQATPMGHREHQMNPPTDAEFVIMHGFTDDLYDWLRERLDTAEVANLDGSVLGFILTGFGDVTIQVTPTGHA